MLYRQVSCAEVQSKLRFLSEIQSGGGCRTYVALVCAPRCLSVFDILQIKIVFNLKTCVVWVLWIVNIIANMSLLVTDEMQSYIFI